MGLLNTWATSRRSPSTSVADPPEGGPGSVSHGLVVAYSSRDGTVDDFLLVATSTLCETARDVAGRARVFFTTCADDVDPHRLIGPTAG
ncbi:Uncharacterised protein [Clostridioides difficile]|nr:Uncharacterised protein [Clostridioides difficile]